jgi:hypothetical protein
MASQPASQVRGEEEQGDFFGAVRPVRATHRKEVVPLVPPKQQVPLLLSEPPLRPYRIHRESKLAVWIFHET